MIKLYSISFSYITFVLDICDPLLYENTSTPLHDVCWRGLANEVQWLIDTFKYDTFSESSLHGWTPLHSASYGGHLEILQLLIHQYGCDPNESDHNSVSILHMASYKGHISIVQYLIDMCHVPPDEPDESNITALLYAAIGGHSNLVEFFVNCNCNTSQLNFADASLSLLACMSGQVALVHKLEDLGLFSPNCKSSLGTNILHYTCQSANDNLKLFQYLLSRTIDSKDRYGRTPLHTASMFASSDIAEFIMNTQNSDSLESLLVADHGNSCLHFASLTSGRIKGGNVYCKLVSSHDMPIIAVINDTRIKRHVDFFKSKQRLNLLSLLLRKASTYPNFDINATTKYGESLLHLASQSGNTLLVKALQEYNITSSLDYDCQSPAHKAASSGSTTMLNYIISQYNLDANLPDRIGRTPLMYSCSSGSINAVEYLINCHNSDPNVTDRNGMTCLHHSCRNGHIDITQYLIEVQHCDINKTDDEGRTLVHHAASSGNFILVQYLITELGLSPTAVNRNGLTALHYASFTLNLHLVQELVVARQLDPHQADKNGKLPIHCAAQSGAILILDYLVKSCKCNLIQTDTKGWNVFHYSSSNGNLHFIKHVISQYPECKKLLHTTETMGSLPLHLACQSGNAQLVAFLIDDMKCDVTATSIHGKTCVSLACCSKNLNLVQLLIQQYKLNPFPADKYGFTALHAAAQNDCIDILEWYSQQYSVDIANCSSRDKYTLAHLAANNGALKFLKHLINEYQCDVNATSSDTGSTSLHLACENGHLSVVLYLTSLPQCNISATTLDGSTVLHKTCMCISSQSFQILKYLVENYQLDLCAVNDYGMAPIHIACSEGQLDSVQYIIEHSPSLLELPESVHGRTPFLISVIYNQLKVVQYLISKNCNLSASDDEGYKSTHLLAMDGSLNTLKCLVDNNYCDLNATDHQERTPLHVAILADQFEIIEYILNKSIPSVSVDWLREVKYLLDSPQDLHTTNLHINAQDKDGNTPLHLACEKGKKDIVSLLVKSCHSSSYFLIANKKGETPLHLVAAVGSNEAAEALLFSVTGSLCHELFAARDNEGCTVFHTACSNGHLDVFRCFCNIYPDGVHVMDDKQCSLLYVACKGRNIEIVKELIEKYKLDPESKDTDGTSCLHLLAGRGHVEMYQYLKQHIRSTAIPYNKFGRTPLHYACSSGKTYMAIYLIETYSFSPDDPDYDGYTAVHAACESGSIELVRYFLTNLKCNAYTETKELQTLLYFASKSSNLELVRYLVNVFRLKPHPHDIEVAQSINPDSSVVKYLQKVHSDMILDMVVEERRKAKEGGYHEKLVELPKEHGTKYQ